MVAMEVVGGPCWGKNAHPSSGGFQSPRNASKHFSLTGIFLHHPLPLKLVMYISTTLCRISAL